MSKVKKIKKKIKKAVEFLTDDKTPGCKECEKVGGICKSCKEDLEEFKRQR